MKAQERPFTRAVVIPVLMLVMAIPVSGAASKGIEFFVSPKGSDTNSGTKAEPFRTIPRGLAATRNVKGFPKTLSFEKGVYELGAPLVLGEKDNGLKLQAVDRNNPPRLIGGRLVRQFAPLKDEAVLKKLPASVRTKVLVADLKKQKITDYGEHKAIGFGQGGTSAMELFVDGQREKLARYPNVGWLAIESIPGGEDGNTLTASLGADRLQRWSRESDPWLYGYWYHGWADRFVPVEAIDVKSRRFTIGKLHHYGLRKGQRFFAQNLLCELDEPGEYFIDRELGKLYFYPRVSGEFEAMVSVFETPIIQVKNASDIQLVGLSVEAGRSSGVLVSRSRSVRVESCRVRNVGGTGIIITQGKSCTVTGCEVYATGSAGISLNGGDRKTLTPAGHVAEKNHVHHVSRLRRTYTPAIAVNGVSNKLSNNLLHHAPHQAISFGGNDHVIELNEIHHVVLETDDSGAIYTCPRDYTSRGTIIRHNYIHHCGPHHAPKIPKALRNEKNVVYEPMHIHGTSLIYLDDLTGGMVVEGNVLEGAYRAMLIGGGRDNRITGNLILGGNIGIWIDGRGLGWAAKRVAKGGDHGFFRKFEAMGGDKPPYVTRYPGLKTVLANHPAAPVNTVAQSNIVLGAKLWKKTDGKSDPFIQFLTNYNGVRSSTTVTPKEELESLNSNILKKINFGEIPFDQIGLP